MRVLWLCNFMVPFIAKSLNQQIVVKEGWLAGLSERLLANREDNSVTLAICFPTSAAIPMTGEDALPYTKASARGVPYYMFHEDMEHPETYDASLEETLHAVVEDFVPDIVHIFGTEYPHTLAMVRAFGYPDRTLIGIQGLCSLYADAYMADLPASVQKKKTFRDWLKKDGLIEQQQKFVLRGQNEKEALAMTAHVTGRTDFDREYAFQVNPNVKYHFMNETLRDEFYHDEWNIDRIERYSIFVSQGNYPIKGLHYVLEILPELVAAHEETMLYVAGDIITSQESIKDRIKLSGYGSYLLSLLHSKGMKNHVRFLGRLQAGRMCARYLKSHVFLCPSAIENSPNSVGEAMLLGVPVVSSDVGGVHNLLDNNRDGLLYPHDKPQQMKQAIMRIFEDDKLALSFSSNARNHAAQTHDPDKNYKRLLEIYHEIDHSF